MTATPIALGERVFVAGTTGRYGLVTGVIHTPTGLQYMVHLDGHRNGHSGPFTDVWPSGAALSG